jgi:hypothetical protein
MKNPIAKLSARPRFAALHHKGARIWAVLNAAVIATAVALPLLALSPDAHAEDTKPTIPASGTLKEVLTRGSYLVLGGYDIEVTYTPDGKFTAMQGQVQGKWRVEGEKLCTSTNVDPVESCALYPANKTSGDTFEIMTPQGLAEIRIK